MFCAKWVGMCAMCVGCAWEVCGTCAGHVWGVKCVASGGTWIGRVWKVCRTCGVGRAVRGVEDACGRREGCEGSV
eukprot:2569310-Rhodomonas_salina.1